MHIVRLVRICRDQRIERWLEPVRRIDLFTLGQIINVAKRQVIKKVTYREKRVDVVIERPVSHSGLGRMRGGATQLLVRDHFVRHGLHNLRTGDIHVGRISYHKNEVGHRR